ncbi:hypothetical protein [Acidithiobacillus sp.]|uniref:hypothetical protein n=1 Tax=Acidithiobacillus sp. TaxID=1872118 RepID=UPI003CFBFE40
MLTADGGLVTMVPFYIIIVIIIFYKNSGRIESLQVRFPAACSEINKTVVTGNTPQLAAGIFIVFILVATALIFNFLYSAKEKYFLD